MQEDKPPLPEEGVVVVGTGNINNDTDESSHWETDRDEDGSDEKLLIRPDDDEDDKNGDATTFMDIDTMEDDTWWEPDLGPEPSFKLMGVAEYTLPQWTKELQRNKTVFKDYQKMLGPRIFVAVQNLNYSVTLQPPFMARPNDSRFKKIWTWFAKVMQFQLGIPINRFNRIPMQPLKDCTFYFKPGEMTLVLGAPDCGKDALFRILGNRLHDGKAKGKITYNGEKVKPKYFHHQTTYIGKNDTGIHVANMTVRETLEFSHQCRMPDAEIRPERVDIIMQVLKLAHRADTIVGDAMRRGVSGGERRRVTIGVELVRRTRVFYLDEPTTGLDASAALTVLRVLKALAMSGNTVVCAVKQPSFEILSLFDKIMIMSKGQIAFHGSSKQALRWFGALGYFPREDTNPAEFLQDVVEYPRKYALRRDEEEGEEPKLHTPQEFIDAWRESSNYQELVAEIELQHAKLKEGPVNLNGEERSEPSSSSSGRDEEVEEENLVGSGSNEITESSESDIDLSDYSEKTKYPISILDQYWLLQKRELIAVFRDRSAIAMNIVKCIVLAFFLCTLFFQLDHGTNDTYNRKGVVFFAVVYFAFSAFSSIASAFQGRDIFRFQREYKYFRVLPYTLANTVSDIPMSFVQTMIFGTLVYWIVGLNANAADKYVYFLMLCFALALCMNQFCRMAAYLSPNMFVANIFVPGTMMALLLYCGFFIPQDHMPYYFIWIYYITPLHYAIEGAFINEFTKYSITCKPGDLVPSVELAQQLNATRICPQSSGLEVLSASAFSEREWVKWLMLVAVLGFTLIFFIVSYMALRWIKYGQPGDKYSPPLPSALENPQTELEDLSDKYNKKRKLSNFFLLLRGKGEDVDTPGSYFSFRDVSYTIPFGGGVLGSIPLINKLPFVRRQKLRLLNKLSGFVKPGMSLALMGASGAGKSTLLDVIGQRKTYGKIEGEILINGHKVDKYFNRMVGYVEQQDIHVPTQTVREAIELSAMCRLPSSISKKQKKAYAEQVIQFLGMQYIAGIPLIILPPEDMKLVTIGTELAADPALLLLDEPTSGLDNKGALKVVTAMTAVARDGKPVICTIHQPSKELFGMFSHLLLLQKGGELVYYGPVHSTEEVDGPKDFAQVLSYFDTLGLKCPPRKNPADFILDVSNRMVPGSENIDLAEAFRESDLYQQLMESLDEKIFPESANVRHHTHQYATNLFVSGWQLMKRNLLGFWRIFMAVRLNLLVFFGLGLLMGFTFFQSDYDQKGVAARAGLLYYSLMMTNLIVIPIMGTIIFQRAVYYRERAARTYRSVTYLLTLILSNLPFLVLYTLVYCIPVYWLVGFQPQADKFFIFLLIMVLSLLLNQSFLAFIGAASPTMVVAFTVMAISLSSFSLFSGFLIKRQNIPPYWIWAHYIDFTTYPLEAFLVNEFTGGIDITCSPDEYIDVPLNGGGVYKYCPLTSGDDFLASFDYSADHLWRNIGIMFALCGVFLVLTAAVLAWWKQIKR